MRRIKTSDGRISRRYLLRAAAAVGGGLVASGFGLERLLAQGGSSARRFVFVYVPGGWDQLLFLDPREAEYALPDDAAYKKEVERTQIDTSYTRGGDNNDIRKTFGEQLNRPANAKGAFYFGPAVVKRENGVPVPGPNLVTLFEQGVPMSIIRGMNMGTLGHEPGYMYMLTGEPAVGSSARGTSIPIRLAALSGAAGKPVVEPVVPTIAMGVESYTGSENGRYAALQLGNVDDLGRVLQRTAPLTEASSVEQALAAYAARPTAAGAAEYDAYGLLGQIRDANDRTNVLFTSNMIDRFAYVRGMDAESVAIREHYGIGNDSDIKSAAVTAAFVAQAIKNNLAQYLSVVFPGGGDSHFSGNKNHANGLYGAVAALSALIADLSTSPAPAPLTGSWLENTTIVVFSEFGRTPLFNTTGGRDHHFTNSCLLVGAGVRPGEVVGASSEVGGMQPRYFDFAEQTSLPDDAKPANERQRHITPDDIGATLLASAGLDHGIYRNGSPLWNAITEKPY